jgi:hypothetical protein
MKTPSRFLRLGAAALAVLGAGAASAAGNLVVNGDFELPSINDPFLCFSGDTMQAWTHSAGAHGSCYIKQNTDLWGAAYSGKQLFYLNDFGTAGTTVQQGISLTAGTTYQLSFEVSGLKDRANAGSMQVQLGSFSAAIAAGPSAGAWHAYAYQYTPQASGLAQLKFTSISGPVNIDAVSLVALPPVPEPTTWALMLSGLLALGALRRRRH